MAIGSAFAKDMKMFFRDFRSFALLFITPIVLVLIIGATFLGTSPSNINIAICSVGSSEISIFIEGAVNNTGMFSIMKMNYSSVEQCRINVNNAIRNSSVRAGLIIPEESKFSTTKAELVVDNSKIVGDYIRSYFRIATNDLSQKIAKGYVDIIFSSVDDAKKKLDEVEQRLRDGRNRLFDVNAELQSVRSKLESAQSNIISAKSQISSSKSSLFYSSSNIDYAEASIDEAISRVDSLQNYSVSLPNTTFEQRNEMLRYTADIKSRLNSAKTSASNSKNSIDDSKDNIASAETYLNPIEISSAVASIDNAISMVNKTIGDTDFLLDRFIKLKNSIQSTELNKPETTQFVDVSVRDFFAEMRFIDFLFPSTLMMVIMVLSLFLASITFIRQRSAGLIQRISIAPHGIRTMIISRLMQIAALSIITVPIIMAFGIVVFNINTNPVVIAALFFAAAVTSVIFASIGMIVASFSRYESTAILLSILIILPMIFLSGILVPSEKLPAYLAPVADALPLNITIRMFEGIMFYSVDYTFLLTYVSYLLAYFFASMAISRLLIRPKT